MKIGVNENGENGENGGNAFLIRRDLKFSMSLWKEIQLLQILNELSIKH